MRDRLKDDDLAGRMGMQLKELNKIMAMREAHKLVQLYVPLYIFTMFLRFSPRPARRTNSGRARSAPSAGSTSTSTTNRSATSWSGAWQRCGRSSTMACATKGCLSLQYGETFQMLEVDRHINLAIGSFNCDICGAELMDNESAESVIGSQDRMQRINCKMRLAIEGMRKTEVILAA